MREKSAYEIEISTIGINYYKKKTAVTSTTTIATTRANFKLVYSLLIFYSKTLFIFAYINFFIASQWRLDVVLWLADAYSTKQEFNKELQQHYISSQLV